MGLMLLGAIAMASFTISLFFLRFWKKTGDRFFLYFAAAFLLEGGIRVVMGLAHLPDEQEPLIYLVRFVSYAFILVAIIDKNRGNRTRGRP
jgi:hypothetical protein